MTLCLSWKSNYTSWLKEQKVKPFMPTNLDMLWCFWMQEIGTWINSAKRWWVCVRHERTNPSWMPKWQLTKHMLNLIKLTISNLCKHEMVWELMGEEAWGHLSLHLQQKGLRLRSPTKKIASHTTHIRAMIFFLPITSSYLSRACYDIFVTILSPQNKIKRYPFVENSVK